MSVKTVNIEDYHTSMSQLVSFVLEGNEVILAENNKPLARMVPFSSPEKARVPGLNRGEIWVSDDFDAPLPEVFWTGKE